ncbi:MAG TPA: hypothetical protein PK753_06760 [Ignavibacteria bacterium]|nr:hypothetical protein [Ignavibacteria bacterium]
MNCFFTILILLILSAGTVHSQEEDFIEPSTTQPKKQDPKVNIKKKPKEQNTKKEVKEAPDKNLNAKKNENNDAERDNASAPEDTLIRESETIKIDTFSTETPKFEDNISEEELELLASLKSDDHYKAISKFSQAELRALGEIPAEEIAKAMGIPVSEAKKLKEEIIFNTVKPYDKTPIDAPESITSIPGLGLAINTANDILTAGLDMTPKQRKKAQTVVLIILILVILPESYRINNSKNKK